MAVNFVICILPPPTCTPFRKEIMNSIIKDQLSKCRVAVIPQFEDTVTHICISKINKVQTENMVSNRVYLIRVKPSVKTNDTIAFNWNNGLKPLYEYYKVEKVGVVGNMIKVNGFAVDTETGDSIYTKPFYGYLPNDGFEILEEV